MCAQFLIKIKKQELLNLFPFETYSDEITEWDTTVRGFIKTDLAPVLYSEDKKLSLKEMNFSLCPSWSKEFPYPWTTYNARMERPKKISTNSKTGANSERDSQTSSQLESQMATEYIYQVPTWREAFSKGKTCLIPMQGAIESSYFGSHAGKIIQFSKLNRELFFAVGIYDSWLDKRTGEIKNSFALITDNPNQFFFDCGHDRSIFCIDESQYESWLFDKSQTPKQRFDLLRKYRVDLNWEVSTEREMKKGWEKRAPSPAEVKSVQVWRPS